MSFFRSAEDATSTSYDEDSLPSRSRNDQTEDNGRPFRSLNRIETLSSDVGQSDEPTTLTPQVMQDSRLRQNFLTHALLEDKCLSDALAELRLSGQSYSKDDPEVKALAAQRYRSFCGFLRSNDMISAGPERAEHNEVRHAIRQGLDYLSHKSSELDRPGIRSNPGSSTALKLYNSFPSPRSTSPAMPKGFRQMFQQMNLRSSSPEIMHLLLEHPLFDSTRYGKFFQELGILGKGGYGKVYRVRNTLDRSEYAVKKVVLNTSRVERIRERGQAELDILLAEVVALAKLDHPNIVRYYSGWLEYCAPEALSASSHSSSRQLKLLEGPEGSTNASMSSGFKSFSHRRHESLKFEHSMNGAGQIVFESSERSRTFERRSAPRNRSMDSAFEFPSRKQRYPTSALGISPVRSEERENQNEGFFETMEEESEVFIQREASIRTSSESSTEMSAPHLVLHVQMALYPLNLAEYLMPSHSGTSGSLVKHCFHLQMSLRIFLEILDGVEYLHRLGMVHRDLKPSNVFMSTQPQASHKHLDLGACKQCKHHSNATSGPHLNLRIGDFGLVAQIARPDSTNLVSPTKAVGTELYRPLLLEPVQESLDVYALGVIAFELLHPFDTSKHTLNDRARSDANYGSGMERHDSLQALRKGILPPSFMVSYGDAGTQIANSIKSMVHSDPQLRPSCADIRSGIERLIE